MNSTSIMYFFVPLLASLQASMRRILFKINWKAGRIIISDTDSFITTKLFLSLLTQLNDC